MDVTSAIQRQYALVQQQIAQACARAGRDPASITLVAVTKFASIAQMVAIARLGAVHLGESRVQTLQAHRSEFAQQASAAGIDPDLIQWHMIGHLQRNKVKQLLPMVAMVQSVDSLRLAQEISAAAQASGRAMPILLEVNAGQEAQKHGFAPEQTLAAAAEVAQLPGLNVQGLMSMAPLSDDAARIRQVFATTRRLFDEIRAAGHAGPGFRHLSMGMTGDFELAIEEGATIVRIGSLLFAEGSAV